MKIIKEFGYACPECDHGAAFHLKEDGNLYLYKYMDAGFVREGRKYWKNKEGEEMKTGVVPTIAPIIEDGESN